MIRQQLHLASRAVEAGDGQIGVAQRGQGNGFGVDWVGLATLLSGASRRRHQPGMHAHD
ncbi:hypothetical protein Daura_51425 [Dactylosporangium aurantiacum]|uniref:Uncharacterized protein n=1 Tax=Dactylosporangium aurantiacum TaxID=35754 RepID=A0A9Q9IIE3_9ACTN|nr:hypothetical protein [Dactylosporangium aurantiacum]UWZ54725.1 hypothetical protein Daura_51425 [Dactylosporangium aurantiacum]